MKTKIHLSVNIKGMLENYRRRSMKGLLIDDNGKSMSDQQARDYLYECLAKGWKVLPTTDCEGFDHFGKGCPGHKIEEKPKA